MLGGGGSAESELLWAGRCRSDREGVSGVYSG